MATRYERGEDLWTGEPLRGDDADQWLEVELGLPMKEDDEDVELRKLFMKEIEDLLEAEVW